jgi:hypothetical protein
MHSHAHDAYVLDRNGSIAGLQRAVERLAKAGAGAVQILASTGNRWDVRDLDIALRNLSVPAFGGLFPGLIHEGCRLDEGTLVIGHPGSASVVVLEEEQYDSAATVDLLAALSASPSLAIYADATTDMSALAASVFEALGGTPSVYGGGAGCLDFVRRPVVITPEGLRQGASVLAALGLRAHVGLGHGWSPIGESMVITESVGPRVISLDWRPAVQSYLEVVGHHGGQHRLEAEFAAFAPRYPFILDGLAGEGVVRDPLRTTEEGHILFAGDMPAHATVRVATGDEKSMRQAASAARRDAMSLREAALAAEQPMAAQVGLTIDCISRALLQGPQLGEELRELQIAGTPQVGALTIGEFANAGSRLVRVHNKTCVLAIVECVSA